ncbi:MAG: glycoside hydrolase family 65 protein [Spirochaetes bacterium]|nr:glycoside hydrolase family 65 protein [Spirochaetota bacterium]
MSFLLIDDHFDNKRIELNGSRMLIGNGYLGYRGTLDEYTSNEKTACIIAGLYNQNGDNWREPVNLPNSLYTHLKVDNQSLSVLKQEVDSHQQCLNLKWGILKRKTVFTLGNNQITVTSERFASLANIHLICMKYTVSSTVSCQVLIETGIDTHVWDLNGPHLKKHEFNYHDPLLEVKAKTTENEIDIEVMENIAGFKQPSEIIKKEHALLHQSNFLLLPDNPISFVKGAAYFTALDQDKNQINKTKNILKHFSCSDYEQEKTKHIKLWDDLWKRFDVEIKGDKKAAQALRFSIYHRLIITPNHQSLSIPARGLSGQVYKGAVFWDTEIFMLPVFIYTQPEIAKKLLQYRINTLPEARKKAQYYGYQGVFYAWESQETGYDVCSHFNVTDVFTNRKMRTYFRDKQIHINGAIVYGIKEYISITNDHTLLLTGGEEVVIESALFYYSYAYYKKDKNRYEILDITGPDEYHERVNNNRYTNWLVKEVLDFALFVIDLISNSYPDHMKYLNNLYSIAELKDQFEEMAQALYLPQCDPQTKLMEQFDGYFKLDDISLEEIITQKIHPTEYLGGGNGLAAHTQIIKQADTVLLIYLFADSFTDEEKRINWEYYEPRTEHGSSLSYCIYSLLGTKINKINKAYQYFLKTALIDIDGQYKQYIGPQYIGGTHPAANCGAWMTVIFGFCGLQLTAKTIHIAPQFPEKFTEVKFSVFWLNTLITFEISPNMIVINSTDMALKGIKIYINKKKLIHNGEVCWRYLINGQS